MRLLRLQSNGNLRLTKYFAENEVPQYAILSHTWEDAADEVTFQDVVKGIYQGKAGFQKIKFCGKQAARDGLQYFWVDSCCIDKFASTELDEAINLMFLWYRNAVKCYVYLTDVRYAPCGARDALNELPCDAAFGASRWFTRGWTLQELLAPRSVEFFSKEGGWLGNKTSLETQIQSVTGIDTLALRGALYLSLAFGSGCHGHAVVKPRAKKITLTVFWVFSTLICR